MALVEFVHYGKHSTIAIGHGNGNTFARASRDTFACSKRIRDTHDRPRTPEYHRTGTRGFSARGPGPSASSQFEAGSRACPSAARKTNAAPGRHNLRKSTQANSRKQASARRSTYQQ